MESRRLFWWGHFPHAALSPTTCRAATQELAVLISRMQANADQVERDILETQKRLQQVRPMQIRWHGAQCHAWQSLQCPL